MANSEMFTIKIGGQAGQGIKSAGLMLAKVATRSGYHIYDYSEYPSLVRGGHNAMQISISQEVVTFTNKKVDFLIALNQETIDLHQGELAPGSEIVFDEEDGLNLSKVDGEIKCYPIPLTKLATAAGGQQLLKNTVALGATAAFLGVSLEILKELVQAEFADKSLELLRANDQALVLGFDFATTHFSDQLRKVLMPLQSNEPQMIVNGNEAIALGSIAAGMQFTSIYPMTPTSSILQVLADHQEEYGYIYKQPEDEISAINMAIGASFAGARAMTATSGGGFCLMSEGLGLSAMTETPLVIIEGMRPGPATGMPTWTEQGDLLFVLHAHQGDFPRIVLAAGDAQEAFHLTMQAFNLADKYQCSVVLIVDKNICENDQSFSIFDTASFEFYRGKYSAVPVPSYQRFELEDIGVSTRTIPGVGNFFIANSDEHNSLGYSSEKIEDRVSQMQKRMSKIEACAKYDMPAPQIFGPEKADLTIVSWGSNKGSILQALKQLPNVNFLHLTWMNPFPTEVVTQILSNAQNILDVEANYSGQLASLIREKTGIEIKNKLLKYDGRPIYPEEVITKISEYIKHD